MFAANLSALLSFKAKNQCHFIFYFLKLYNFCCYGIFGGSTGSEFKHIDGLQFDSSHLPVSYWNRLL